MLDIRSGRVYPADNPPYLTNTGDYGYYWSSTPHSNGTYAYYLNFNTGTNMNPSNSNIRYLGYSLRCLAR